jgi:hypothetical protein
VSEHGAKARAGGALGCFLAIVIAGGCLVGAQLMMGNETCLL